MPATLLNEMQTWYNIIETTGLSKQTIDRSVVGQSQILGKAQSLDYFVKPGQENESSIYKDDNLEVGNQRRIEMPNDPIVLDEANRVTDG